MSSPGKKDVVVFGIKREDQINIDFPELRKALAMEMGFSAPKQFIQFIGDSALYTPAGTAFAKQKIDQVLTQNKESIVLYGYTGSKNKDGQGSRDVNQSLSDWVDADEVRAERVIANIVDKHTVMAINQWGCTVAEKVRFFFLVYSDTKEPSVEFGQDIPLSDGLTDSKAYSLEGGIQSLRQIMYMLNRDVTIHGITNLRDLTDPANPRYFDPATKRPYLSAVEFIQLMKEKIKHARKQISAEVMTDMAMSFLDTDQINLLLNDEVDKYFTPHLLTELAKDYLDFHALYNKSKGDAPTKDALWDAAWKDLIEGAWKKLSLFSCEASPKIVAEDVSAAALSTRAQQQARAAQSLAVLTPETLLKPGF